MKPERILGLSDVARELGLSVQVVSNWYARANGRLPKPNYLGPNGAPLWRRRRLEDHEELEFPQIEKMVASDGASRQA
jgi:predicted DNA-binding transcriptional regulator AlpA